MGIPSDAVLPRKLRELESALRQAFASRRNQETDEKIEEGEIEINDEISRRIEFLRNLLCAEMESHQGSKPTHLFHIAERLALLEDAYQRWLDGGSSPNEDDALDNVSTCSCTFSCFNEEEEEHETPVLEDPWLTEAQVVSLDMKQSGMNLSAGPKKKGFTASLAALLTAGIAAAAAAVVTGILFNCFKEAERTILLAPT